MGKKKKEQKRLAKLAKQHEYHENILDALNDLVNGNDTEETLNIIEGKTSKVPSLPSLLSAINKSEDTEYVSNYYAEDIIGYEESEYDPNDDENILSDSCIFVSEKSFMTSGLSHFTIDINCLVEDDLENDDYDMSSTDITSTVMVRIFELLHHLNPSKIISIDEFNTKYKFMTFDADSIVKFVQFTSIPNKVYMYFIHGEQILNLEKFIHNLIIDMKVFSFLSVYEKIMTTEGISQLFSDTHNAMNHDIEFSISQKETHPLFSIDILDELREIIRNQHGFKDIEEDYEKINESIADENITEDAIQEFRDEYIDTVSKEMKIPKKYLEVNSDNDDDDDDENIDLSDIDEVEEKQPENNEIKEIPKVSNSDFVIERR